MRDSVERTVFERLRGIARTARDAVVRTPRVDLVPKHEARLRQEMRACLAGRGGEVSARNRAAALGRAYLALNAAGRARFLELLAEFQADRGTIDAALEAAKRASTDEEFRRAARALRELEPPWMQLLRQFNSLPQGVKFLVDLRADLLTIRDTQPALSQLEADLRDLLASWFDVGFLELKLITWDSPAALLEKLARYEAVHEVRNWHDLKNRLDVDRRCFAFLHPLMPMEPLIFVEVALVDGMSENVASLLDSAAPVAEASQATTAIFYSISNCQKGLAGISFGNALIKRVVDVLSAEFRSLKTFATLSPIPGFAAWLDSQDAHLAQLPSGERQPLSALLARRGWHRDSELTAVLQRPLMRLCAHYLLEEKRRDGSARDPVAHFHLSNGARMERLNWLADVSRKGMRESAGMMVNYLYRIDQIDDNHEAYAADGRIAASNAVRNLLR